MDALLKVTLLFAFALAISLLIERMLEILKAFYDYWDGRKNWHGFWTGLTYLIRNYAEKKLRVFEYVDPKAAAPVLNRLSEMLLNAQGGYGGEVPVLSGDLVRALGVKIISKVVGMAIGVILAIYFNINLIALWKAPETIVAHSSSLARWLAQSGVQTFMTGIIVGLGSTSVHKVIRAIENKQKRSQEEKS